MNSIDEQPEVLFGSAAQVAMRDELARQLREAELRADCAEAAPPVTQRGDKTHALFDAVSKDILLAESPDLRVARLLVRRLVAAVQERDEVISRMRQVLLDTAYVHSQRFSLEDDPAVRQER